MSNDQLPEGYKQTEVGAIPEDWDVDAFGRLYAEPSRNGIYKSAEYQGQGIRIVNMGEMFGLDFISDQEMNRILLTPREIAISGLRDGDLLFGRRSVVPAGAGKCSIVIAPTEPMTFESSIIRVRLKNLEAHPLFYYYFFSSPMGREVISSIVSGTNIKGIRGTELQVLKIPQPSLPEQRSIATALSDVDALIASLDKLIAKKQAIKTATMQQLLTGKKRLPGFGEGRGYEKTEVGVIPEDWDVKPLSDLIDRLEAGVSVNSVEEDNSEYTYKQAVLKTSSVFNGEFFPNECKKISLGDIHRAKVNPQRNTIIISRMNTPALVGECGYVSKDYNNLFLPDRLWITRFKKDTSTDVGWLSYILSYSKFNKAIKDTATGTSGSMKNIAKNAFLQITIPCPKEEEQRSIATVLSDIDAEITALEVRRAKTQAIKQGMMQELLTGRTRLV